MSWLYFTLLAYLINAVAFVVDKYLLLFHIPRPFAYAFWVAILSAFAAILIPFGVVMQNTTYLLVALVSGGSFFTALVFLYKAIKESDVSVASTMSGVMTAVFTYFFAIMLVGDPSDPANVIAMALLVVGMLFLGRIGREVWPLTILAGLFFAVSFVLLKLSFEWSDFINGLFWTRMGFVGVALSSLVFKPFRYEILSSIQGVVRSRSGVIFIANKVLATAGFLTLYYAIRLGKVSIVNSLLGFQFLFIFIIALLIRSKER